MVIFQDNSLSKIPQPSQYKSNKSSSKDLNNNMLPSRSFTRHNVSDALKPYFPSQNNCSKLFTTLPKYVNPLLKKNMTLSLCDEVSHEKLKKPILIKSTSVTSKIEMLNGTDNSIPIKLSSQTENATLLYNSPIVTHMRQPNIVKDKTSNHNSNEKATLHTPNFYFLSLDKRHHLSSQTKHSPFIRNGTNRSSNNSFSFYIPIENNYDRVIDQNISHISSTLHSKPLNPSNSYVFCSKAQLENEPNHNISVDNGQALNLKSQNIAFLLDDSNHMIDIKNNGNNDNNMSKNLQNVSHATPPKYKNTLEQSKVKTNSSTHLRNSMPGPRGCNNSPSFIYTDFKLNKPRSYHNKTNSNIISNQISTAPNISANKNNIFLHGLSTISSPQNVKPFNNQCQQIAKTKSFIQKQSNTQMTMSQNYSDQNGNSPAFTPTISFNTTPANTDSLSQERNFTITKSSTIISQIKPPSNKRSIIPQLNTFTLPQSVSHDINSSSLKLVKLKSNNSIDTDQKINPDTISNSIVIKNPKNDHSEKGSYHQVHEKLQNVFQKSLSVDTANLLENTFKDLNCCCIDANNAKHLPCNGLLQHNQCETVSSERIQEGNCSNENSTLLNKNGSFEKFSHKNNINIVNDKVSFCDLEVPFLYNDGNSNNNNNKIPAPFKNQSSISNNKCDTVELLTYQLHTLYEKYMNVMEENRKLVELLKEQLKTNVVACHHFIPLKVPENLEYPLDKNHPDNIYNIIHKLNIKPPPNMTEQMEQNIQTDLDNLEDQEVEDMYEDDFLTSAQYAQDGYSYGHHHRPQNNQIYHINSLEDIRIMENHSIAT